MAIDPLTGWAIAKAAGELSKKLYEFGKGLKDRELKQQLNEILDGLHDLKHSASLLEDENRDLRDKLRFKGEDFDWQGYYHIEKKHPDRPLCPKCYSNEKIGHWAMCTDQTVQSTAVAQCATKSPKWGRIQGDEKRPHLSSDCSLLQ
jgi:hypothetical protein